MDLLSARASIIDSLKMSCAELELITASDLDVTLWAIDTHTILSHLSRIIENDDRGKIAWMANSIAENNPETT